MRETSYQVAGHRFSVRFSDGIELSEAFAPYAPFAVGSDAGVPAGPEANVPAGPGAPIFRLDVVPEAALTMPQGAVLEFEQDDEGSQIRVFRTPAGENWFEFLLWNRLAGKMRVSGDFREASLALVAHGSFALGNALMVMYALSTAKLGTALFHAAVIGYEGKGYLFLGKSGTGKSTHARLWLKHVPGSELINDDNPVVRVFPDGSARVYGSPWSGKTPCYRNVDLPAGGFVQLAQAPYNAIRRLRGISAYASLLTSISGKRWDRSLADGLHETENALAAQVPVWHLDCLPDAAAAQLCRDVITQEES